MYCQKCGKEISESAKFCKYCGAELATSTQIVSNNQELYSSKPKGKVDKSKKGFNTQKKLIIEAGERAIDSLEEVKRYLNKAKNWGVVDILGGGMITSAIKHSNIDNAQMELEQAKKDLAAFTDELRDVNFSMKGLEFGSLISVIDVFCDNVFADIMVQHKISKAKTEIDKAIRQIETILEELEELEYEDAIYKDDEIKKEEKMEKNITHEKIDAMSKYICLIQELKEYAQDDELVNCLADMEKYVGGISAKVRKHPEFKKNSAVIKLKKNYIPQTTKLMELYRDETTSENAMKEISDTLKTCSRAYANIDKELSEKADVETLAEIEVLKSSFSRDGIVDPELEIDIEE